MSVIDTLIFDRTEEDVQRVYELKRRILTSGTLTALTPEEQAEWLAGMKGAYNAVDMNRVGQAVAYLAGRFTALPGELAEHREELGVADAKLYHVPYDSSSVVVTAKQDWQIGQKPTKTEVTAYLADLSTLRRQLPLPPDAPEVPTIANMDNFQVEHANNIEYLLYLVNQALESVQADLYSKIDRTAAAFRYINTFHSGQ